MEKRKELVLKAKCADYSNQFKEMFFFMKELCMMKVELNEKESEYLSSSISNYRTEKKESLRRLGKLLTKEKNEDNKKIIREYCESISKELMVFYSDVLDLLKNAVLPFIKSIESKVFFFKLKGDVFRYQNEIETMPIYIQEAKNSYNEAMKVATFLPDISTVKLLLVCNYTFFLYDVIKEKEKAVRIATEIIEKVQDDPLLKKNKFKDSKRTIDSLKENVKLWLNFD